MRHVTLLVVVLAVTPLTHIRAQDSPPVAVGTRVRVTAPTLDIDKYDGTLQAWADDRVTVDTLQVALAQLTRLDVYRGRKSNWGKGALIGGSVLGAAGLGLSIAWVGNGCEGFDGCNDQEAAIVAVSTVITFAGGALLGAVTGAFIKSDKWEEVPLDQLRVSFVPQRDGRFAFGLSVAF